MDADIGLKYSAPLTDAELARAVSAAKDSLVALPLVPDHLRDEECEEVLLMARATMELAKARRIA